MITEGFVFNGAKVYICSRNKQTIQGTADTLTKKGSSIYDSAYIGPGVCIAIQADLSTYDGCVNLATELASKEDRILA